VLIWVVLGLTAIVGVLAINLDGGRLMDERRSAQAAAAADLYTHWWDNHGQDANGTALTAAQNAAVANGYPASAVTVNIPPQSGTFAGNAGHVEVILQTQVPASFGQIFTNTDVPVRGRAVARGQPMNIGLILLNPSASNALLNKALLFTMVNTPVIVNSTDPAAFDQASFGAVAASRIDVTGGYVNSGGALMLTPVNTGVTPTPDPLTWLPAPNKGTAAVQSATPLVINSLLPTALQPGVYQGGIHVTGASIVTMAPGV
jgi:hypothetical protein